MFAHSGIRLATAADLPAIRELLREYAAEINEPRYFTRFDEELRQLPGDYGPPDGRLWIVEDGSGPVGCVAYRPWMNRPADGIAELKRLFVRPRGRGFGLARALIAVALKQAQEDGYQTIRLDTLDVMTKARALYAQLGFREIPSPANEHDSRLSYWQWKWDFDTGHRISPEG